MRAAQCQSESSGDSSLRGLLSEILASLASGAYWSILWWLCCVYCVGRKGHSQSGDYAEN